jgi:hypothetical protein
VTALGGDDTARGGRPALVGLVAACAAIGLGAAAALLLHGTGTSGVFHRAPPATQTPRPLDVTPQSLAGVWVGALGPDALVLTITPRDGSEDRVECALNAGLRELIAFEAVVERGRGLAPRARPGREVRFGPSYEDADGRLLIPLVDDDGRVRARLSKTESLRSEVVR